MGRGQLRHPRTTQRPSRPTSMPSNPDQSIGSEYGKSILARGRRREKIDMFQIGALVQGRYRIQRPLGQGGMGTVFLARHERLDRLMAIKVMQNMAIDPGEWQNFVQQFESEGRILAALDHPNLARVTDFFDESNHPCLVMEYIEGKTLEEVVQLAPKPLAERRVLEWAGQMLDALQYLHTRVPPIIVRDLKSSNLILGTDGRIRLIDFGLARILHPGHGTRTVIKGMGTEGYAPLEQYGTAATDQKSDLYALGATLLYLLSGGVIPPGAHLRVTHSQGLMDPRTVNPSVSDNTWCVIQSLMSILPDKRPSSACEVARLLLGSHLNQSLAPAAQTPPAPVAPAAAFPSAPSTPTPQFPTKSAASPTAMHAPAPSPVSPRATSGPAAASIPPSSPSQTRHVWHPDDYQAARGLAAARASASPRLMPLNPAAGLQSAPAPAPGANSPAHGAAPYGPGPSPGSPGNPSKPVSPSSVAGPVVPPRGTRWVQWGACAVAAIVVIIIAIWSDRSRLSDDFLQRGLAADRRRDSAQAHRYYSISIWLEPARPFAYFRRWRNSGSKADLQSLFILTGCILDANPNNADIYWMQGLTARLHEFEPYENPYWNKAIRIRPDKIEWRLRRAHEVFCNPYYLKDDKLYRLATDDYEYVATASGPIDIYVDDRAAARRFLRYMRKHRSEEWGGGDVPTDWAAEYVPLRDVAGVLLRKARVNDLLPASIQNEVVK